MDWLQVVVLAVVQGLTEFLPISSSAHLILPAQIWGWIDQGLLFDVAVHAGTLCAVLWYFRDKVSIPRFEGEGGAGEYRYGLEVSQVPRWSLSKRF